MFNRARERTSESDEKTVVARATALYSAMTVK